ncbi:hypothetical protein CIL05_00995 [Virgibacillus profundi]|uniref:ABC transporter substrate-binding protein n=1 Tax=Virgibacillus profundi TaxID=2024555 RepID=A0A2A2IKI4_9BACI|nr:hypothetical protein CIL05_00995 [Virgibacillus profundi]PXY55866.1 hypothetical protein CIT14_01000 [Virgibacillus profundi]
MKGGLVLKLNKVLFLITTIVLLLLVACNNDDFKDNKQTSEEALENLNKSGMPIVNEEVTLDIFAGKAPANSDNWNDIMIWDHYSDMTNINVNWELVPHTSLGEKRNLALASGTLPDVFYGAGLTNLDLLKYGEQGIFIPLNDLIDNYAPNLKTILDDNPDIRKAITFPDGNIYSLPNIRSPQFLSMLVGARPWINQEWLNELGMDIPESTEEFYQYLKKVKEEDPNGNGKADEIPYGGNVIDPLIGWLKGSFGLGNQGKHLFDMDPNEDKLRFIPVADEYKEMLEYVHKLYSENLIEQNIFSIDYNQYLSNASEELYGSTVFYDPEEVFGIGESYEGALALVGPDGEQAYVDVDHPVYTMGNLSITSENENPEATIRWLDYFYGDEGAKLFYMGVEGETYKENSDGSVEYLEKITNSAEGLTFEQELSKYLIWIGTAAPGIVKQEYFRGSETTEASIKAAEKLEPYIPEEIWPKFTYLKEENDTLSALGTDIEKYVSEMRDKFITGDVPLTEWDNYVETIENMGLEEYMSIQESAYERYQSN